MTIVLVGLSVLTVAAPATAAVERPLNADLVGAFAFGPCPPSAPAGARCLHDRVSGPISYLGQSTGEFDVVLDFGASGPDGCAPADKRGFFVAANGDRLDVAASGRYCFATSATTYAYTVTGGSGRFVGATGTGSWLVPAPRTFDGRAGEGDEQLRGTIAFTEPATTTRPRTSGRLRVARIRRSARQTRDRRLRTRVFSNRQGLHGVIVTIHRGSPSGRTLGRSRGFRVASRRAVDVRLGHALRAGRGYVAVAVGRDRAGHRVEARRYFRLRR